MAQAKQLEAQGKDIIHMEVGEPDFDTPQPIINAGITALKAGKTHYTPALGFARVYVKLSQTGIRHAIRLMFQLTEL